MPKLDEIWTAEGFATLWRALGGIAMVAGGWAFTVLLDVQKDVAALKQSVSYYATDRYRADEARRDFELRDLKISTLASRIESLERDVHSTKTQVEEIAPPVRRRPN